MGYSSAVSISSDSEDYESNDQAPAKQINNTKVDFDTWKRTLRKRLNGIKSVGDIANFTRYPTFANPGLKIEGHPAFPLPLTPSDAEVIKAACREAPFGKGEDTVVDTSVRKTWELNHTQFQLINPEWAGFLQKVYLTAAGGLGLTDVSVKPHKLLLYEKGSFFKRHKDSEKEPGMVGTLVICLPSKHQGGDVHLAFGSDQRVFSTAPTSTFDITTLAWFSDVTHEVKELTSGYRLALTYNIVQNGSAKQSAGFFGQQAQEVKQVLLQWQVNYPGNNMLVYPLDHKSSQSSLSFRNMKGRDKAVCQAIQDIGAHSGVFLLLAHQTHTTEEDEDYYDNDAEPGTCLDAIFTPEGKQIATDYTLDDDEVMTPNMFADRNPDSEDEGEFTGNEGAPSTYRYHDTVAVLIKKSALHKFLRGGSYGPDAHTGNMVALVTKDLEEHRDHPITRATALKLLNHAIGVTGPSQKTTPPVAVYWALQLDDTKLFQLAMAAAAKAGQDTYNEALNVTCRYIEENFGEKMESLEWDKWLGETTGGASLSGLMNSIQHFTPRFKSDAARESFSKWGNSKLTLKLETEPQLGINELSFFAKTLESRHGDQEWIMSSLIPCLADRGNRDLIYKVLNTVFVKREQREFRNAKDIYVYMVKNALPKLLLSGEDITPNSTPYAALSTTVIGPLTEFAYRVNEGLTLGAAEEALQLLEAGCNTLVWTKSEWQPSAVQANVVEKFLVPLMTTMQRHSIPVENHEAVRNLLEFIIGEGLLQQLGPFPPRPVGWTYKPRRCAPYRGQRTVCRDCDELEVFLTASDQKVWRFAAAEARRKHINSLLYGTEKYFRMTTKRTRSPHTLVIEKTGGEYKDEVAKWRRHVQAMASLLSPLRSDFLKNMLGESRYRELILLEPLLSQTDAGSVAGVKREADEPAFGQRPATQRRL
ncbi:hypothetical protein K4K55_008427 [Colletotrichum sp. SAR 10_96]|nr:hypothetical protein K4K55_008427 [Colletotrichum sp. SAR 10_96]